MMPSIKRLTAADNSLLKAVAALEAQCIPHPWSLSAFRSEAAREGGVILAALDENGELLGFLTASIVLDTADITNVVVRPERRGEGIGGLLMQALAALLPETHEMFLEVRISNASAIRLYEKQGFRQVGVRRRFYDNPVEDALLMQKTTQNGEKIC